MSSARPTLLAVSGLSPQIVTETVYALAQRGKVPGRIEVITTEQGAESLRLNLLVEPQAKLQRLIEDYQLESIDFDESCIHVLATPHGTLSDIRSQADNEAAADQIAEHVRRLTADGQPPLHVSLAGGRKTMGYYLGYALSLFGRAEDRLSHVLVSAPFESHPDFYYPTPYDLPIQPRNGQGFTLNARDAVVELAEIPFVRLRSQLRTLHAQQHESFSAWVEAINSSLAPQALHILPQQRMLRIGHHQLVLSPREFLLYTVIAGLTRDGQQCSLRPVSRDDTVCLQELRRLFLSYGGEAALDARMDNDLVHGFEPRGFDESLSRINRKLTQHLGAAATPYCIDSQCNARGRHRRRQYGLGLPSDLIHIDLAQACEKACLGAQTLKNSDKSRHKP